MARSREPGEVRVVLEHGSFNDARESLARPAKLYRDFPVRPPCLLCTYSNLFWGYVAILQSPYVSTLVKSADVD